MDTPTRTTRPITTGNKIIQKRTHWTRCNRNKITRISENGLIWSASDNFFLGDASSLKAKGVDVDTTRLQDVDN